MDFGEYIIPDEHIIIKTKYSYVFTNLRPFLPFHTLISPISKKAKICELTKEETDDLFNAARLTTIALKEYGTGFTINIQDGKAAGQTVSHVHIHIIPRNDGDLKRNDDIYKEHAIDAFDIPNREFDVMKNEAIMLRKLFEPIFEKEYFNK